ncbi:MAG: M48 family metalloprotease, partial [Thiobacillus sp.]
MSALSRTLLALALAVQPALATDLPDLGEVSRQYFSDQEEQALGRAIMRDVYADPRYLDDPEIETYLNQLGYKLVSVSTRNQREFTFFVVNDPTINAFALPGGNIGVHTGLLLTAQNESELASVIGHEIAHVTQDHIARMVAAQSQSYWPTMAALALALLAARSNPNVASAAIASTQAYSVQNQLNYTRDYEREADRLGYEMLTRANFDPHSMSAFFNRMQRASRFYDSNAPAYLRTHPLTSERIADMEARSESAPYQQVEDSLDFQLIRARLRAQEGSPADAVLAAR